MLCVEGLCKLELNKATNYSGVYGSRERAIGQA